MRKLLLTAAVLLPFSALGDHLDVIQFKLNEGCTLATYRAVVKDFNDQWGAKHAYHGEIAVPVQSPDLESYYWIGMSYAAEGSTSNPSPVIATDSLSRLAITRRQACSE